MSIYKPCDIRGIAGRDLTRPIARRIGRAVGELVRERNGGSRPEVLIGGDVRVSTPGLMAACRRGLREAGCDPVDLGIVPTPVVYFARRRYGIGPAIVVTASHNPARYNGFKIHLDDGVIFPEDIDAVERLAGACADLPSPGRKGRTRRLAILGEYLDWLAGMLPAEGAGKRVAVDAGNGTMGDVATRAFRRAGFEVRSIHAEPDGRFPHHVPNPSVPGNLRDLGRYVRDVGAFLGVAFDTDGDRVGFVDAGGAPVETDSVCAFLAERRIRSAIAAGEDRPPVVHDIKCASTVPRAIEKAGGIPVEERSGHAFIRARMVRENALFGGEASGHYFYRELGGGDDGLYSALRVAIEVVRGDGSFREILARYPVPPITPDLRIPCDPGRIAGLLRAIREREPADRVSTVDGVRVSYPDGWALARPSVTEPILTLRFEGRRREDLPRIARRFLEGFPELQEEALTRMIHEG